MRSGTAWWRATNKFSLQSKILASFTTVATDGLAASRRRFDVLVQSEKVCRIVFPFDLREAIVIRSVGGTDARLAFIFEIVHIDAAVGMEVVLLPESVHPGDRF